MSGASFDIKAVSSDSNATPISISSASISASTDSRYTGSSLIPKELGESGITYYVVTLASSTAAAVNTTFAVDTIINGETYTVSLTVVA